MRIACVQKHQLHVGARERKEKASKETNFIKRKWRSAARIQVDPPLGTRGPGLKASRKDIQSMEEEKKNKKERQKEQFLALDLFVGVCVPLCAAPDTCKCERTGDPPGR